MEEIDGLEAARELRKLCRETYVIFVTAFIPAKQRAKRELARIWRLPRGSNTPPLWGELAKKKLSHAPLLAAGYLTNYTLEGYKVDAIRYLLKTDKNFEQSMYEGLDAVFQKMQYKPSIREFAFQEGTRKIALEKIIYIESNLHKLTFCIIEDEIVQYTMYETLNHISGMFSGDFVRIHQSYLVNLRYIRKIVGNDLLLLNNLTLPVARSKLKEVRQKVAMYKGVI